MNRAAALAATVLACVSGVAASGCGVGPGEAAEGEANLSVTRDYGAESLLTATLEGPTPSDTVVRFLDLNAEIETDYGGNFVSTIEGLEGSTVDGGAEDWFFFVNGIYSEVGAGEAKVHVGDRVWWDYRRWQEAYRVPAVVGSWPEPFLHGHDGQAPDVVVECVGGAEQACGEVGERLLQVGVEHSVEEVEAPVRHPEDLRILVGDWDSLRDDPAARQLEQGPGTSGVYGAVRPCPEAAPVLEILDQEARPLQSLADWGLVAAVREGGDEPTWLVTASTEGRVSGAAGLLDEELLRNRYALARSSKGASLPLPAREQAPQPDLDACG